MKNAVLLALALAISAAAQDPRSMIRASVSPEEAVMVGQPVKLTVDVLVTSWLTGSPEFPRMDVPGAIVLLPDDRPEHLTERIGGQTWFGLRRSYLIYPQEPREYQTPSLEIVVQVGGSDGPPAKLAIPARKFRATVPPEADGLGYFIPTRRFQITQSVTPGVAGLKVGDSIRRTVTMTADGVFAMLLPPLELKSQDGLAAYPDQPHVEDLSQERAGFQAGRRTESVAYVIQREGNYELPAIAISWWDLSTQHLQTASVPAVSFTAAPNPDYRPEIAVPTDETQAAAQEPSPPSLRERIAKLLPAAGVAIALLVGGVWFARRCVPPLVARFAEYRRRRAESESAAFAGVQAACRSGSRQDVIRSLYVWIDRAGSGGDGPATLQSLVGGSKELDLQCRALFSGDAAWDGSAFASLLERARRQNRDVQQRASINSLPPLNPMG